MKTLALLGILAAAVGCAEPTVATEAAPIINSYPMLVDGPDNDELPARITVHVDQYDYFRADVDFLGHTYALQFAIAADGSRVIELLDPATGDGIDATEHGDAYTLALTIAGATTTYHHDGPPTGPPPPDTAATAALLLAFDIPDELEWVPAVDAAAIEADSATYFGGPKKGKRKPKPKVTKPKGTKKTCPKPGRGSVVVAGCAVVLTLCLGTELTCNGPQQYTCPDGRVIQDACGCGQSICNKCFGTCSDECSTTVDCSQSQTTQHADPVTPAGTGH